MSIFLLLPNNIIVDERIAEFYDFDSKVELTKEQEDCFYYGVTIPDGKRRITGTLELEDIPSPSIDKLRSSKQSELRSTCESKINAGFIADVLFPDCNYRNDRDQQNNIRDCALGDGGYIWMNEDFTLHTKEQAQSIYALSRSEVQSHKLKYAIKCEYLNHPSRTTDEIQAVTWDSVE